MSLTDTTNQSSASSFSVGSVASVMMSNSRSLLPGDISQTPLQGPVQPKSFKFPASVFGKVHRSFNCNWFDKYMWLEYSILQDAAFCFPCRFFAVPGKGRTEDTFTSLGYRDWKHATGRSGVLEKHDTSHSHHEATISWQDFKLNIEKGTGISNVLDSARSARIKENRHYIKTVADILLLCARQNIGLRGHRENEDAQNKGNFLEILRHIAKYDKVVADRLREGPRNAIYTAPSIQNEILDILAYMVRQKVCSGVREAGVYTVLADETKDLSKKEQLSISLRFVDEEAVIREHFLTFVHAQCVSADSLTEYIVTTLKSHHLDLNSIVSQGYDGASVMSGQYSGVQQRLKSVAPYAIYVHCYAHTLNLVLVDSVKNVSVASEFFALAESLYVFISTTKANVVFLAKQKELYPDKQPFQMQRLSDTRWACRYNAVNALCVTYDSLLATLEHIADDSDSAKAVQAKGLYLQIKSFSFLVALVTFDKILSFTKHASDQLQSPNLDLASAADLVAATQSSLLDYRTDEMWHKLYTYTERIANHHCIEISSHLVNRRNQQPPQHLSSSVIMDTTGSRQTVTNVASDEYKVKFYFPVIDSFLAEISRRFDAKNLNIMKAIHSCHPTSKFFLKTDVLQPLVDSYDLPKDKIEMEASLAKRMLEGKELATIGDVLLQLKPLSSTFPNLSKLVRIAMTIAVSTAQCERSFSTLKLVKTIYAQQWVMKGWLTLLSCQLKGSFLVVLISKMWSLNFPVWTIIEE